MNTVLSNINLAAPALLLVILACFSSCKKENDHKTGKLGESITGKWELSSFTIDGLETMGTVILASKIKFETCGDGFEWSLNYGDGSSETQTGNYEEDYEDEQVELKSSNGEVLKLKIDFDAAGLNLSGNLDGERIVIKADRDCDQPQAITLFIHDQL